MRRVQPLQPLPPLPVPQSHDSGESAIIAPSPAGTTPSERTTASISNALEDIIQPGSLASEASWPVNRIARNVRWPSALWYAWQEAGRRDVRLMNRHTGSKNNTRSKKHLAVTNIRAGSSFWLSVWTLLSGTSTLWVLYGRGIYFLMDPPLVFDKITHAVSFVCVLCIALEMILRLQKKQRSDIDIHPWEQWCDLLAIMSLAPDVFWLFAQSRLPWSAELGFLAVARAARAAKASSRASQHVRKDFRNQTIPLVRQFFRNRKPPRDDNFVSQYASADERRQHDKRNQYDQPDMHMSFETPLSRELAGVVSGHLVWVVGVLFLLAITMHTLITDVRTQDIETKMQMLSISYQTCALAQCEGFSQLLKAFEKKQRDAGAPVLYLSIANETITGDPTAKLALRQHPQEYIELEVPVAVGQAVIHLQDTGAPRTVLEIKLLAFTLVIVVLVIATSSLTALIQVIAVNPIQRIVFRVSDFAANPLRSLQSIEDDSSAGETQFIEAAIDKFCMLLQVGYGEAGAKLITAGMTKDNIDQDLVSSLRGNLIVALHGFGTIRNFNTILRVCQADSVGLVNAIAGHVHMAVRDNFGAPHKLNGTTFELVWKPKGRLPLRSVTAHALRSIVRTIIAISWDRKIQIYMQRTKLQEILPGKTLKMGFGLHYGWAIEGTIGTANKIDISYMSPHVGVVSSLEAASKIYGVEILMSDRFYDLLPPDVQKLCRLVDVVMFDLLASPTAVYTYGTPEVHFKNHHSGNPESRSRYETVCSADEELDDFFREAPPSESWEFRNQWDVAMKLYLGGTGGVSADWRAAAEAFQRCLKLDPWDGPASVLLEYIRSERISEGAAPACWGGFRTLNI